MRHASNLALPYLALLLLLTAATPIYSQTQSTPLEIGKTIERDIKPGEPQTFSLSLPSGMYGRVEVHQKTVNVAVTVYGPDEKQLRLVDLMGAIGLTEEISLVAPAATTFQLVIRAPEKFDYRGSYSITLKDLHPSTDQDKARVQAEKLTEDAWQLFVTQASDAKLKALDQFQKSVGFWHLAKDQANEARSLYYVSYTLNATSQYPKAAEAAEQGIPIAQAAGSKRWHAYLLDELGASYSNRGDRKKSLDIFQQALTLRSDADPVGLANTLNLLAMAYSWTGDSIKALEYMERVVSIMHNMHEPMKESTILGNMCVMRRTLGHLKKALELCTAAVAIKREINDQSGLASVSDGLGSVYGSFGDYQKALDRYQEARAIRKKLGDAESEAMTLSNIGWAYGQLGEYEKALEYYSQALEPLRKAESKYGMAQLLTNMGVNWAKLGDYRKALDFHLQSLEFRSEKDDPSGKGTTLSNIANSYEHLGDKQKALENYLEAVRLLRGARYSRQLTGALKSLGVFYRNEGQLDKARENLNEARTISATTGDQVNEATALSELARLEFVGGNLPEALKLIEQAIAATESVRVNLKSQQLRTSFLASVRQYYEFETEVLMRLNEQKPAEGFAAAALQVSEKSRARSLLELLREARAELRQGVDPSLVERESVLRQSIADKADQQTRLLSGKATEEQKLAASKEMDALTTEYDQVQTRIRQTSPRYAALVQPAPLNVEAIQKHLLDENTLLLEYALGEQKSFVWAVTPESVKAFELPGRATIEQEAKRFYQLLTEQGTSVPNESLAQRKQRLDNAESDLPAVAANVSRMLLQPLAADLKQKRLVIVADGVLQYLPFSALTLSDGGRPLIVDHEIVTLPSASVLAVLREEFEQRKPASKLLAVLADPVFSANDPRLAQAKNAEPANHSSATDVQRSAIESGLGGLVRLRFSRQEAEEIARLAGDKRNLKALDFSASRSLVTKDNLSDYRIVHFATHGLINNQNPDLSGVVLSLVDEQGRPQNGFLRLYDIYNLKLDADLVVLSACQTALGKEIKGEGLVGLTRGFMYAGAPRVVASLWRIDDRATADIMKRFYEAMLKDGMRPAAALRAAQISMSQDKRWHSPHYWAAFTLQGEWR
ncbi:MAG TPA: CHAT domain-containing protein [Pyrinomonadaceae bacterium]|nr:CHAT domain-containing protein [Pyrinomonadaceae bacterium]